MPLSPEQTAEIEELRSTPQPTLRATVPGMEAHLYKAYDVLDHGFIRVIDYMGDDAAITQAARVSYGKGTKAVSNDEGLIRYLMRNWHSTPFEMCELTLHVKLPVFVARQWIRHRTANSDAVNIAPGPPPVMIDKFLPRNWFNDVNNSVTGSAFSFKSRDDPYTASTVARLNFSAISARQK